MSDEGRDGVAESIGAVLVWVWDLVVALFGALPWVTLVVLLLWLGFRVSLIVGDHKLCWWCKGKGYKKALLGGVRVCPTCGGKGIRPRAWSGKR